MPRLEVFDNKGRHYFLVYVCHIEYFSPDAPVHPPVSRTHPYDGLDPSSFPTDMGYSCKMIDGVVHVFTHKSKMEK